MPVVSVVIFYNINLFVDVAVFSTERPHPRILINISNPYTWVPHPTLKITFVIFLVNNKSRFDEKDVIHMVIWYLQKSG